MNVTVKRAALSSVWFWGRNFKYNSAERSECPIEYTETDGENGCWLSRDEARKLGEALIEMAGQE